jgi:peptidoglycan-associated lipoprotein
MKRVHSLVLMGFSVALVAAACGKKAPEVAPAPQPNADSLAAAERARADSAAADSARRAQEEAERIARQREADSAAAAAAAAAEVRNMLAAMIHFDFDKAVLRPDDQGALDQKVAILTANPDLRIRISGHCDERGSDEYNLALGNRRATAAKNYLVSHGVDASRIETASYGEERPVAMGHDEDSWAQNRRDEFEILSGGDVLRKP